MARPTKYNSKLASEICELIAQGDSVRKIAAMGSMPAMSTIFKWLNENKEFSEQYARAKDEQAELFADELIEIADTAEDVQKAKLRIDTRKWVASKLKPKKYGDKLTNVHTDPDGNAPAFKMEIEYVASKHKPEDT